MRTTLFCTLILGLTALSSAGAATIPFTPVAKDDPKLSATMHDLAARALPLLADDTSEAARGDVAALQIAAGDYDGAVTTLRALRAASPGAAPRIGMEMFATAKAAQESQGARFDAAYAAAFASLSASLSDQLAYDVAWFLGTHPDVLRRMFERTLEQYTAPVDLAPQQALELVRGYAWSRAAAAFWSLIPALAAADDARRYVIDENVVVATPDGATVSAIIVRPRSAAPLPALLSFGIYTYPSSLADAKESARHGYVGVLGFSRGKYLSRDAVAPFEHDGADARALIEWIVRQPWSDGRVGMYGGSYKGFTQWAVLKDPPAALKGIMSSATAAPGIAEPMEGGIFFTRYFPWVPYVASGPLLDEQNYNDTAHWTGLFQGWYRSGRPYRELDSVDGVPSPIYRRWLAHPDFDEYWQSMIPHGEEFARIDIPVLQTTGYYDGGQVGSAYYFIEHLKHNSRADHTLVIGPYTHLGSIHQSEAVVGGYAVDPVARMDFHALRYAWFDHVLKGAARPAILADRINYQVMGANEWRHAPSLEAMGAQTRRLYLARDLASAGHALHAAPRQPAGFVETVVDLEDRSDAYWVAPGTVVSEALEIRNALTFVSEPFARDAELSGLVRGRLDVSINKRDFDFSIRLYELTAAGQYIRLSMSYQQRASYLADRTRRQLLRPNELEQLTFVKPAPISRRVAAGSRIVVVLAVNKSREAQINYGTGKDISDESIEDAGEPLRVRWYESSYIDLPFAAEHQTLAAR